MADNNATQSLFDTARAMSSLDPASALDMAFEVHRKALNRKAEAVSDLALINSQIRLLGNDRKRATASLESADDLIEKAQFLISTLEASL